MEFIKETLDSTYLNIEGFSKIIGEKLNIASDILKNYILANVSVAMVKNDTIKKNINKLYLLDKLKYHEASSNSTCSNHIIITQGTIAQEIDCRKALGILLVSEKDYNLRNTIVNLLRKTYPMIYNAVKKHDKRELTKKYLKLDTVNRKIESRLDAAVYFYFGIYRSNELIDQDFFISIINDMKYFEFCDPITRVIPKELDSHKSDLQEIKSLLKREYGKINNYSDILNNKNDSISSYGEILENLFIINKFDINHLFYNSSFLNIDEILLSYIKSNNKNLDLKVIIQSLINGIFIKSLINEYKKARNLYFENHDDSLLFKIESLEKRLLEVETENKNLLANLNSLKEEKESFQKILNTQKNGLNKKHKFEVLALESRIKELENQLKLERSYRNELNELREYVFKINSQYIPTAEKKTLDYFIARKKFIIIGGTREWRRKFREKYPELRTLTGFNSSFDSNILASYDFVFFYTGFMDHATYYKAINFIRAHNIKFGYIGKTNIELVEDELIEELEKHYI